MLNKIINQAVKNKIKIRSIVFWVLSLIAYWFTIFYLFGSHDVLWSIVCVFFLYIMFHFMSLDIKKFEKRYILLILFSLFIIDISILFILSWESNIWLIFSLIFFNVSLYFLFDSLRVINFKSIWYFLKWWYIFTLLITITYSIALIGMFQKFPFTCEWLQDASDKLIEFVEFPFRFSIDKIDVIKDSKISNNQENISFKNDDLKKLSYYDRAKDLDNEFQAILLKAKNVEVLPDPKNDLSPIIWQFNQWKESAVDQIINQQESYSSGMCDMLLEEINAKYNLKEFKLSAILLTYLLLFGFVRVAIFIMSLIWFIAFKILYILWLYKVKRVIKEVKEIK